MKRIAAASIVLSLLVSFGASAATMRDVENVWPSWAFTSKDDLIGYVRVYAILGIQRAYSYAKASHAIDVEGRTVSEVYREPYHFDIRDDSEAANPDDTDWDFCEVRSKGVTYWMLCTDFGHGYGYGKSHL